MIQNESLKQTHIEDSWDVDIISNPYAMWWYLSNRLWSARPTTTSRTPGGTPSSTSWRGTSRRPSPAPTAGRSAGPRPASRTPARSTPWSRAPGRSDAVSEGLGTVGLCLGSHPISIPGTISWLVLSISIQRCYEVNRFVFVRGAFRSKRQSHTHFMCFTSL